MYFMILSKGNVCGKVFNNVMSSLAKCNVQGLNVNKRFVSGLAFKNECKIDHPVRQTSFPSLSSRRHFSTSMVQYGVNVRPMTVNSRLAADRLIRDMTEIERDRLAQALEHLQEELELEGMQVKRAKEPSMRQLSLAAFSNAVPFIGFGFLDNAIMIVAGEYIDLTLGAALGISTMAAAAIGNMISDVAGIGLAGYVEGIAGRLGVEEPHLTAHQLAMKSTRWACHSGRAIGIIIGCIIGMFPLLLVDRYERDHIDENPDDQPT